MKILKGLWSIIKRLFIFLLILAIIIVIGVYFMIYFSVNERHEPYMDLIMKYSEEYRLEPELVTAIIKTESDFEPEVVSHADAVGLMQLIPDTGEWVANRLGDEDYKVEDLTDPETNIRYGTYYFKYLFDRYKSVDYAVMAYNAGFGNVDLWIEEDILTGDTSDYLDVPIGETRHYIRKVKNNYSINKKIFDIYYLDNDSSRWEKAFNMYKVYFLDAIQ